MRQPLFIITDGAYSPKGAIACDDAGRFVGTDTSGTVLFNRKDLAGAVRAGRSHGKVVSSAWYGVEDRE